MRIRGDERSGLEGVKINGPLGYRVVVGAHGQGLSRWRIRNGGQVVRRFRR
jgi:hypothetical protein